MVGRSEVKTECGVTGANQATRVRTRVPIRRVRVLRMTDLHDLQTRAGEVEKAVGEANDQKGNLLAGIRDGLSAVRDRLIHMKIEKDRLVDENARLKQVIVELLESLENESKDPLHDKLRDLDSQLSVLLELSGADSAAGLGDSETGSLGASKSDGVDDDADEPAGVLSPEANGASPNELGSLEDIEKRVRKLSEHLAGDDKQTKARVANGVTRDPEPIEQEEPAEPHVISTSESPLSPALEKAKQVPSGPDTRESRAFHGPIEALAHKARSVLPKRCLRFDAEVNYALGILQRLKGGNQPFSIKEVRDLINGKFDLGLTSQHDAQITASVSKQDDVRPSAKDGKSWKFHRA